VRLKRTKRIAKGLRAEATMATNLVPANELGFYGFERGIINYFNIKNTFV